MIYSENVLVCMAVPLLLTLIFVKANTRQFVLSFLLGMAACLLRAYVSGFVDAASGMGVEDTAIFISPVSEEVMKFLPLLFYFLMFDPEDDRLFHAAIGIGAGFASFENVCSMISSGTESLSFLLIRGLAVGRHAYCQRVCAYAGAGHRQTFQGPSTGQHGRRPEFKHAFPWDL